MALAKCSDCVAGLRALLALPGLSASERPRTPPGRCLVVHAPERRVADCYEVGDMLGQGSFGTVSLARGRQCQRECVLKVVDIDALPNAAKFDDEVHIHAALDHPNVVRIYETFAEESQLCILMELCRGGELFDAVEKRGGACSEGESRHIFGQVMQAVHYMHCQGLAHRDLKLENFLVKEFEVPLSQCTIKLIDFGFAAPFKAGQASLRTICGTPEYMAPELFSKAPYGEKCDVWSCGVILYSLLSGDMPFHGDSVSEIIQNLKAKPVRFHTSAWKSVSRDAQRLVMRTCCKDVAKRLSAQQVLADAWLKASETEAEQDTAKWLTPEMLANAEKFGEMCALQRASLHRVAYHLEDKHVEGVREAFLQLDSDNDGKLTREELLQGADNACLSKQECERMAELFDQLDSDGSGVLEYTEFLAGMLCHRSMTCHRSPLSKEACMAAFRCFDIDGSGTISVQEIQRILAQDGASKMSAESMEKVLERCDINGDGEVCFEDFMEMLRASNPFFVPHAAGVGGA